MIRIACVLPLLVGCALPEPEKPPLVLEVAADGSYSPADFVALPVSKKPNSHPVIMKTPSSLTFKQLAPLLQRLIEREGRVNIAIESDTLDGPLAITIPIQMDHGGGRGRIWFFDGNRVYNELETKEDGTHLWLRIRAGKGGAIRVESIDYGYLEEVSDILPLRDRQPLIPLDDIHPNPQGEPKPTAAQKHDWEGRHPPFGDWTVEVMRTFMKAPDVAQLSPFCELVVKDEDAVGDMILALKRMKEAVPGRVLVSLLLPRSATQHIKR